MIEHYQGEEMIEIFDNENKSTGITRPRKEVHTKGLIHRSVNVFLFNKKGELLIQKRSSNKTIAADHWDLSVAEHLQPNESYKEAVKRGIAEELGVKNISEPIKMRDPFFVETSYNEGLLVDREFTELWRVEFEGEVGDFVLDPLEVSEVKFIKYDGLEEYSKQNKITPWFLKEISILKK
eukprot:TRINITY_DN8348_c0_g1_i1.p1 TRINITY_DN8348_c0_g1~~TRINITY_DN8348_c0_g1_i1.p1  ORF type:complete len:180 (-),score=44.81 TRINITY_DN8348_c0_g1_i1:155-694(-)